MAMHLWLALAKYFSNAAAIIDNTNHHSFSSIVFLRKKKERQQRTSVAVHFVSTSYSSVSCCFINNVFVLLFIKVYVFPIITVTEHTIHESFYVHSSL